MKPLKKPVEDLLKIFEKAATKDIYFELPKLSKDATGIPWKKDASRRWETPADQWVSYGVALPPGYFVADADDDPDHTLASPQCKVLLRIGGQHVLDTARVKTRRGWHFIYIYHKELLKDWDDYETRAFTSDLTGASDVRGEGLDGRAGGKNYIVGTHSIVKKEEKLWTYELDLSACDPARPVRELNQQMIEYFWDGAPTEGSSTPPKAAQSPVSGAYSPITEGGRDGKLHRKACTLMRRGVSREETMKRLQIISEDPTIFPDGALDQKDLDRIVKSATKYVERDGVQPRGYIAIGDSDRRVNKIEESIHSLGYRLSYEETSGWIYYEKDGRTHNMEDNGDFISDLRREIEKFILVERQTGGADGKTITGVLNISRDDLKDRVGALARSKRFNLFRDWADGLPKWDGRPRVKGMLQRCFEIDSKMYSDRYVDWCAWSLIGGIIKRIYEPGCLKNEMIILVGQAGRGKSCFFEQMICDRGDAVKEQWIYTDMSFTSERAEIMRAMRGKLFAVNNEMGGTKKDKQATLNFITTRCDTFRDIYEKAQTVPRTFTFGGSSNGKRFLFDCQDGEARRFACILVHNPRGSAAADKIKAVFGNGGREQIFAEMLHHYRAGELDLEPPSEVLDELLSHAEEFTTTDKGAWEMVDQAIYNCYKNPEERHRSGLTIADHSELSEVEMEVKKELVDGMVYKGHVLRLLGIDPARSSQAHQRHDIGDYLDAKLVRMKNAKGTGFYKRRIGNAMKSEFYEVPKGYFADYSYALTPAQQKIEDEQAEAREKQERQKKAATAAKEVSAATKKHLQEHPYTKAQEEDMEYRKYCREEEAAGRTPLGKGAWAMSQC